MSSDSSNYQAPPRRKTIDRVSGSLVNVVLGALILWVGQTTFRHAGLLASNNERFDSVGLQLNAVDERHERLRVRLEQLVSQISERTRSRFTREDADKLGQIIRGIDDQQAALERQMFERLTSLHLKIIALETRNTSNREVTILRAEVERLRAFASNRPAGVLAGYPQRGLAGGEGAPVHLPPTSQH
jgi:hypothetical protein